MGEILKTVNENAAVASTMVQKIKEVLLTVDEMFVFSRDMLSRLENATDIRSKMQMTGQKSLEEKKKQKSDLEKEINAKNLFIEQEAEKLKNRVNNFNSSGKYNFSYILCL